jgi:hypothetical protein
MVVRTPDAVLRPYLTPGGALNGWQARSPVTSGADSRATGCGLPPCGSAGTFERRDEQAGS